MELKESSSTLFNAEQVDTLLHFLKITVTSLIIYSGVIGATYAAKSMKGFDHWHDIQNEVKIMEGLCHPRLCRLYDVFDEGDTMTLITDLSVAFFILLSV